MTDRMAPQLYGPDYYNTHFGVPYDRSYPKWLEGSRLIAREIKNRLAPRRVLDVGCGKGFLVESLWDLGIEAYGIDISEYAISQVRADIRRFCSVRLATEPIQEKYDLITCVEVLEHLSDRDTRLAVENMVSAAPLILFSSSPFDCLEPTHEVVRPILDWLKLFREFGAFPDVRFDAGFIMPHGILFRRQGTELSDDMLGLYAELLTQRALFVQQDKRRRALDWRGEQFDHAVASSAIHVGDITDKETRFTFKANYDRLCRVDLRFGTYLRVNTCHLILQLLDARTGRELRSRELSAVVLPDNDWFPWRFEPIPDSASKQYSLKVSSQDAAPGNAVTLFCDQHHNVAYRAYALQPAPEDEWFLEALRTTGKLQERLESYESELQKARADLNTKVTELKSKNEDLEHVAGILRSHESSAAYKLITKFRTLKQRLLPAHSRRRRIYNRALGRVRGTPVPEGELSPSPESDSTHNPKVSVVSAIYNKADSLTGFIQAFRRQNYKGTVELVLVDDLSTDGSVSIIERELARGKKRGSKEKASVDVELRLIRNEENLGNCASRDRGIDSATGEIVVIIDGDCIVNKDFIRAHVAAHADPTFQMVIGPFNLESGKRPVMEVLKEYEADPRRAMADMQLQDSDNPTSYLNCITRNFSIKRQLIQQPLFDSRFSYTADESSGFGWEDVEMGFRLYCRGLRVRFTPEAFSVHASHPSAVPEHKKPLKSLRNFRLLYQTHPDIASISRKWSLETYGKILAWMADYKIPPNEDVAFLNRIMRVPEGAPVVHSKPKRLKVLTYRWHCGHQYELYKLPFEFTLIKGLTGFTSNWDYESRPLRPNAKMMPLESIDVRDYDFAILHFDEFSLSPERANGGLSLDWGDPFKYLMANFPGPKVAICHGTPMFYGAYNFNTDFSRGCEVIEEERQKLVSFTKDILVICNSYQAQEEFAFHNSRVIWHGFDPVEYPPANYQNKVLTVAGNLFQRPYYRGYHFYRDVVSRVACGCDYLGDRMPNEVKAPPTEHSRYTDPNEYAYAKFVNYVNLIRSYSMFFNPTLRSPMPRTRGEAMMCGLVTVSADNHDVNKFIRHGENGFFSQSPQELAEILDRLAGDPALTRTIGEASRRTAMDVFHSDRYLGDWMSVVSDLLGSDAVHGRSSTPSLPASSSLAEAPAPSIKTIRQDPILYLTGCNAEQQWCRRCDELPEQFQVLNAPFYRLTTNDPSLLLSMSENLGAYSTAVLHRLPLDSNLEALLRKLHSYGTTVLLDVDDYLLENEGVDRIASMHFDSIFCSTPVQQQMLEAARVSAHLLERSYSQELWNLSQIAMHRRKSRGERLVLGLVLNETEVSAESQVALKTILQEIKSMPELNLQIVGPSESRRFMEVPDESSEFRLLNNWRNLPLVRAEFDVCLILPTKGLRAYSYAEREYVESALLQIPCLIDSALASAINDNGKVFLTAKAEHWGSEIRNMIENPEQWRRIGTAAFDHVRSQYAIETRAARLREILQAQAGSVNPGPLVQCLGSIPLQGAV